MIRQLMLLTLLGVLGMTGCGRLLHHTTSTPERSAKKMIALTDQWTPSKKLGEGVHYNTHADGRAGAPGVMLEARPNGQAGWQMLKQTVPGVQPGAIYCFSCWVRTEQVKGGAGAYLSANAFDSKQPDQRLAYQDSSRIVGDEAWVRLETVLLVPEGAGVVDLLMVLNGSGRVTFSQPELELVSENAPLGQQVTIDVGRRPIRKDFLGFGFEDDPFFYTAANYQNGVDPAADGALRERRIRELKPSVVRAFLFWNAFNPSHDLKNISYQSEMMDSVYRTLDLYQQLGATVNITGAYWGWSTSDFPFSEARLEQGVSVFVQALRHLVREKGYSCIRYVTVINEPDTCWNDSGGTLDTYLRAHRRLREELDKAGLKDLTLVGADVTENYPWMERTIAGADDCIGIYSLHKYINPTQYPLIKYHMDTVRRLITDGSNPNDKPLFLWEYGHVGDNFSATHNPEVTNYRYGLLSAWNCMALMNEGLVGGSFWCLQSICYINPRDRMEFGLWEYKDKGWRIRPSYYAVGLFSHFFQRGARPVVVTQQPATNQFASAALQEPDGKLVLYLLNMSDHKITARIKHLAPGKYSTYCYAENRLPAESDANYERIDALRTDASWDAAAGAIEVEPRSLLVLK